MSSGGHLNLIWKGILLRMYAQQALMKLLHQRGVGRALTRANHMEPVVKSVECMMGREIVLNDSEWWRPESNFYFPLFPPPLVSIFCLFVCLYFVLFADKVSQTILKFCLVISPGKINWIESDQIAIEKLNYLFQGYWQENVTWYICFFFPQKCSSRRNGRLKEIVQTRDRKSVV